MLPSEELQLRALSRACWCNLGHSEKVVRKESAPPCCAGAGICLPGVRGAGLVSSPHPEPNSMCCSLWTHKVSLEGPAEKDKDTVALHWGHREIVHLLFLH